MARTAHEAKPALRRYLADIAKLPRIDEARERALGREIRRGRRAALDELVQANLSFVVRIAAEYRWTRVPLEDLVSAGNLGLIAAARRFDVDKQIRFTTYAAYWIRRSILNVVSAQSRIVAIPAYHDQKRREIRLAERSLLRALRRRPSREELAEFLGIPPGRLERLLREGGSEISLDDPVEGAPGALLRRTLADDRGVTADAGLERRQLASNLRRHVGKLDDRRRAVVALRYGLGHPRANTLSEIGRRLALSRERVRQIESDALRCLRVSLERETAPLRPEARRAERASRSGGGHGTLPP